MLVLLLVGCASSRPVAPSTPLYVVPNAAVLTYAYGDATFETMSDTVALTVHVPAGREDDAARRSGHDARASASRMHTASAAGSTHGTPAAEQGAAASHASSAMAATSAVVHVTSASGTGEQAASGSAGRAQLRSAVVSESPADARSRAVSTVAQSGVTSSGDRAARRAADATSDMAAQESRSAQGAASRGSALQTASDAAGAERATAARASATGASGQGALQAVSDEAALRGEHAASEGTVHDARAEVVRDVHRADSADAAVRAGLRGQAYRGELRAGLSRPYVTKTVRPGPVLAGEPVAFVIEVHNPTALPLSHVTVTDRLAPCFALVLEGTHATHDAVVDLSMADGALAIRWDGGLAAGGVARASITVRPSGQWRDAWRASGITRAP